ncbi:MAG: YitT family protein [Candidatus Sericytochromatia bacterium]
MKNYVLSKSEKIKRLIIDRGIKDFLFITLGVVSASFGLKGFLLPNDFLDGGVTGISLLIEIMTKINLAVLLIAINIPFILIGARQISIEFAIKSMLSIASLALLVHYVDYPLITNDKLLISVFGGFFLGAGIGCSIRGGAVIDGTEVLAVEVSRRTSLTVGDFITLFNLILFSFAATLINIETAMYSMLTYLSASKTVDFIINGIEEYIGVTIVSNSHEEIKEAIMHELGRGVTIFKSESGFGNAGDNKNERNVLFCVVTRLEVTKLLLEIDKIDPQAFIVQNPIKDTKGGIIKKRPLH